MMYDEFPKEEGGADLEQLYASLLKGGMKAPQNRMGGAWRTDAGPMNQGDLTWNGTQSKMPGLTMMYGPVSQAPQGPVFYGGRGPTVKPLDSMLQIVSPLQPGRNDFSGSTLGNLLNFITSGPWSRQPNQQAPQDIWSNWKQLRGDGSAGLPETGWNARTGIQTLMR